MRVTVIGLGAMGGGMARRLLVCDSVDEVAGFDLNSDVGIKFYNEAKELGKATSLLSKILSIDHFVDTSTDIVLIVLVNEAQCQSICFENNGNNLKGLMRSGTTVVVSSTVTPAWSRQAAEKLGKEGIQFLDCPVSGGPVRALSGEITIMASGDADVLESVDPLFQSMGKEIHIITGGAGMGSTVKMVHQLLAGVHIAVAAEALALAAKAGLDVKQLYEIVKGAAGASWMFCDRGQRMIDYTGGNPEQEKVKSALAIFVKDMDIVYSSAKELRCPVPIASAALQQFIGGCALGLDKKDDSQVVKVYETLSGACVSASSLSTAQSISQQQSQFKEGDNVEKHHHLVISNEFTRVMRAKMNPKETAGAHKHSEDSLYFFLAEGGLNIENHVKGCDPACDRVEFGEVRYGTHRSDNPLIHRVTNIEDDKHFFCIDAEVLRTPPITSSVELVAECHKLMKTRDRCRVYLLALRPGQSVMVNYPFFYLSVVVKGAKIKTEIGTLSWETIRQVGDVEWNSPSIGSSITNTSNTVYEQYISEWC